MIYATLARYCAAFLAGVFAMWLWHNASINRIEKNEAKEETAVVVSQLNTAVNDAKQSGDNSENYLSEYTQAKADNDSLRERLRTGIVKLRVCEAESTTAGTLLERSLPTIIFAIFAVNLSANRIVFSASLTAAFISSKFISSPCYLALIGYKAKNPI